MEDVKRRQFLRLSAATLASTTLPGSGVDLERLSAMLSHHDRDPRAEDDLVRLTATYSGLIDRLPPTTLIPPVLDLLQRTRTRLAEQPSPRLFEVTIRVSIQAGWLSYDMNNHGDATGFWTLAEGLAGQADSNVLRAYTLALHSLLVGHRSMQPGQASLTLRLLDQSIELAAKGAPAPLRGWLYAERAGERAAVGLQHGSYNDLDQAYRTMAGYAAPSQDLAIQIETETGLARYRGTAARLLGDHEHAADVLSASLRESDPALLPQRAYTLTDLAAVYADRPRPELDTACNLLAQAQQIAEQTSIREATRRALTVRRILQPWAAEPAVRQLDERLGLR
jgi:hypothetical protein